MRSFRAAAAAFPRIVGESKEDEAERGIKHALRGVGDVARLIAIDYRSRRKAALAGSQVAVTRMAGCLDLRKLAFDDAKGAYLSKSFPD